MFKRRKLIFVFTFLTLIVLINSRFTNLVKAEWNQTITLKNYLNDVKFREELISYDISFPGTFPKKYLKLREGSTIKEYQLSDVKENKDGNLLNATVWFRTGLDASSDIRFFPTRTFTLEEDAGYNANFKDRVTFIDNKDGTAVIKSNLQTIMVPYNVSSPTADHAPIMKISRDKGLTWVGKGSISEPVSIRTEIVKDGNLYLVYRLTYEFGFGKEYQLVLKVQYNEKHVTIEESIKNISLPDRLKVKFSYKDGVDPDGRLFMGNGTYHNDDKSGEYSKKLKNNGRLPHGLGLYAANAGGLARGTVFWNDNGDNAIMFALYNTKNWKTERYHVWGMLFSDEMMYFYSTPDDKYMEWTIVGERRYWALSLIPRNEVVVQSQNGSKDFYWYARSDLEGLPSSKWHLHGSGPEVKLWQKLGGLSLNWVKDIVFEWDEKSSARYQETESYTFEEWKKHDYVPYNGYNNRMGLFDKYYDAFSASATSLGRTQPKWIGAYASSRVNWDSKTRLHVRSFIIWYIHSMMELEEFMPWTPVMAGHPNFAAEGTFPGVYAAVFPNHPKVLEWKSSYYYFLRNYLKVYLRPADPRFNALEGRHVENLGCYNYASMRGIYDNLIGFKYYYDGTDVIADPEIKQGMKHWLSWNMDCLVTAMDIDNYSGEYTYNIPLGDHAAELQEGPGWEFYGLLYKMADYIADELPILSGNLKWVLTNGREGIKPELESVLYNDFGAILRYDFGGPDETYLHFSNIGRQGRWLNHISHITTVNDTYDWIWRQNPNYRWGNYRLTGNLYYASKGKLYSWSSREATNQGPDYKLSIYQVGEHSLDNSDTDQVLYNFDFAQYFREGRPLNGYISRGVMMVRGDYIGIYDDVYPGVSGEFKWASYKVNRPKIIPVKAGDDDNLHIIGPDDSLLLAVNISSGAKVNSSEYVFMSDSMNSFYDEIVVFEGRNGYASNYQLAIFEGFKIAYNDFILEKDKGDFGVSAEYSSSKESIKGRFAGRSGGKVYIKPPKNISMSNLTVKIDGEIVSYELVDNKISFDISIRQSQGYKKYLVKFSNN